MTKVWQAAKADLLKDPELKAEYTSTHSLKAFGMELSRVRLDAGLNQQQLANKVGISKSVLSRLESLDYGQVTINTLNRIADALELELHIQFFKKNI